jgi:Uma2 family endonuclease
MSSAVLAPTPPVDLPAPIPQTVACDVILAEHEVVVPATAHTLAGFRAWAKSEQFPERGHISLLDWEIVIDMSPEGFETHGKVKVEVEYAIVGLNKKRKLGVYCPDRTLITNAEANLSTEPDGAFLTFKSLEAKRVRLVPREGDGGEYLEVEGTPDWVMEVVSDSSVRKDTVRLRERYHKAGIPEYWLIDARGEEVVFQILVRAEDDYTAAEVSRGGWQTSQVFGRRFRLIRRRGRLGLWEYTLQVKPLR